MSEAADAFRRVALLAAEHNADLDAATRLMTAHAWVGGGAPHFAASLATQRGSLQSALAVALAALSQEAVRQGDPAPQPPDIATLVPVTPATHGSFRGIDAQAMADLIAALDAAAPRLAHAGARIRGELASLSLPASPGWTIARAGDWAGMQAPDLRRRLLKIRQESSWIPADIAGFDLFGAYAAPGDPNVLLSKVAAGDLASLEQLLAMRDAALPFRVNTWWRTLPSSTKDRLISMPGLGALNGLPSVVRDQANRTFLASEKDRLLSLIADLSGPRAAGSVVSDISRLAVPGALVQKDQAIAALKNITMIERALALGGTSGHPPAYLLAIDLNGTGRLAISWGDPDKSDITVTYVPGLNTKLSGFAGDIDRARVLWQQSQATSGTRTVASIAWLGYDPPQTSGVLTPGESVATDVPAERGATELATFTDALTATRPAHSPGRHVILGHSYGSLVTGKAALLRPGKLADELIFVGSPGVGTPTAAALGLPPGHIWVGEDPNDPVAMLGHFGTDPGHKSFGANHFPVGRSHLLEAHSSYWKADSSSLRNIGAITTGRYDRIMKPHQTFQPQILLPEFMQPTDK